MTDITHINCTQDYVAWTTTTALYMDADISNDDKKLYPLYGLLDEIGEVAGILKRQMRDGVTPDRTAFMFELGDIAWYLARIHYEHVGEFDEGNGMYDVCKELGMLEETKKGSCFDAVFVLMEKIKPYVQDQQTVVNYILGTTGDEVEKMSIAELLSNAVKARRKVQQSSSANFMLAVCQRINDTPPIGLLMHMAQEGNHTEAIIDWFCLCYRYNFDIMDVLRANVAKLESRKARGVLHGKGSER